MSHSRSSVAAFFVLVCGGILCGQATRDSRPALSKDPLTLMALPPAPDGVKEVKQPVVTIGETALDTIDFGREIAALHWFPAVDALVRRRILDLELAAKKIKLSQDDIEREAVRILADLDPSAQWSHLASTNPAVSGALLAQARDAVGWERVGRGPDQQDDAEAGDNDAKKFLVAMEAKKAREKYKVRKRENGDALAAGTSAEITPPEGKVETILDRQVLEYLRATLRQDELVAAREALIDDWLLGRELAAIGQQVDPGDVAKTVAAAQQKHKAPFDWKMMLQMKGTTVAKETGLFRRLEAWRKLTAFAAKPEDLQAFAKEREGYYRGEYRTARHILFRTADGLTGAPLDPASQTQAETEAKEAYEALKKGADFEDLARTKSDDAATAQRGGASQQPYKQFDATLEPAMRDAVFALTAESPLSKPVRGSKGWYVFKLDKANPPSAKLTLDNPSLVGWIKDDYDRAKLAEYLAGLRKKSPIKLGSETTLTTGW